MRSTTWVSRTVFLVTALVLVASACSGSGEDQGVGADPETTAAAPDSGTESVPSSHGDFSVLFVGNVDELTADKNLSSLEDAGLEGFVKEGSAGEGFDVYWPGLTREQAMAVLVEIAAAPDVFGGLIFETANLP